MIFSKRETTNEIGLRIALAFSWRHMSVHGVERGILSRGESLEIRKAEEPGGCGAEFQREGYYKEKQFLENYMRVL